MTNDKHAERIIREWVAAVYDKPEHEVLKGWLQTLAREELLDVDEEGVVELCYQRFSEPNLTNVYNIGGASCLEELRLYMNEPPDPVFWWETTNKEPRP